MKDEKYPSDEKIEEFLKKSIEEVAEQSEVNPDVYYFDREKSIQEMGGLSAVMALDKEEIQARGIRPGGHSLEDLRDMPDHITIETLVESEYGDVKDRIWLDRVERDIEDFNMEFYGGVYLVEDDDLKEYIMYGTTFTTDDVPLGQSVSLIPSERYENLDELVEDEFRI